MYRGTLKLNETQLNKSKSILEYGIVSNCNYINLSETFNSLLGDKVHIEIEDQLGNDMFNEDGKLTYKKINKEYLFYLGDKNLDEILRNNIDKKMGIAIKCLSERGSN